MNQPTGLLCFSSAKEPFCSSRVVVSLKVSSCLLPRTMSMIFFATVVRVRDGLPLSASTDFYHTQDFVECRKRLKKLTLRLAQCPGRGSAESCDFRIHFSASGDVACMAICSRQCPTAMAFCFLETLWWEFTASYDSTCIGLASRPYAFLEFDNVIQKIKWHFNCITSSQMKSSMEKIQEELEVQPPVVLTLDDVDVANGVVNGHVPMHLQPAPHVRMEPVTALGILSLVLNILCAALNLIRGVHLAEHSLQVAHEEIANILAFLIPFVACICQVSVQIMVLIKPIVKELDAPPAFYRGKTLGSRGKSHLFKTTGPLTAAERSREFEFDSPEGKDENACYLYLFYSPARTMKVVLMLLFICLGNVYLHGLRNLWQILFHIGVAFLSSYQILSRQLQEKQSDCGV
ncbi:vesicle-trafficking protein SEC22c isoform X2 [Ochotona curzoniae]|uniref:vesicle-trafficking protein SEC22c isoform X2 n=1 Tax=Ochotona curzoniae TaxID=130825 RepID=UPI001B346657|nr:vesicle-trafficking protein SEC22c isoform X2 [Ochotona curzoniae]